jgi:putative transposase
VHAWVLMTNPVHRLLTPDAPNGISQGMQSPGRRDAQYVNCCCKRSGSVREGRFKSSLIQT